MSLTRDKRAWKVIESHLADVSVRRISDEEIEVSISPRKGGLVRVVVTSGSGSQQVWRGEGG